MENKNNSLMNFEGIELAIFVSNKRSVCEKKPPNLGHKGIDFAVFVINDRERVKSSREMSMTKINLFHSGLRGESNAPSSYPTKERQSYLPKKRKNIISSIVMRETNS